MPSLFAESRSTLSNPVPQRAMTRSFFAFDKTRSVNGSSPARIATTLSETSSAISSSVRRRPKGFVSIEIPASRSAFASAKFPKSNDDVDISTFDTLVNLSDFLKSEAQCFKHEFDGMFSGSCELVCELVASRNHVVRVPPPVNIVPNFANKCSC